MSLVGSLEDLSLGDILQIISLSRKSGVLSLETKGSGGRIVFVDGLVRGAAVKDGPIDLRGVLVGGGFLEDDEYLALAEHAEERGGEIRDAVAEMGGLSPERIESLCREAVESAVMTMFSWTKGDFSFDVRSEPVEGDPELLSPNGLNAQYLAMECARVRDEDGTSSIAAADPGEELEQNDRFDEMSAHEMFGVASDEHPEAERFPDHAAAVEALAMAGVAKAAGGVSGLSDKASALAAEIIELAAVVAEPEDDRTACAEGAILEEIELDTPVDPPPADAVVAADALEVDAARLDEDTFCLDGSAKPSLGGASPASSLDTGLELDAGVAFDGEPEDEQVGDLEADVGGEEPSPCVLPDAPARAVILIDGDLVALEWMKGALQDGFDPVHIFQQTDPAMARIRQYLVRGEPPVVLIAPGTPVDRLGGVVDAVDFVGRLKAQSPRIVVHWLREDGAGAITRMGTVDGVVVRPDRNRLRSGNPEEELAADFLRQVRIGTSGVSPEESGAAPAVPTISPDALRRLRDATESLTEASSRGAVLPLVIRFASEVFARVAMFMVREGTAFGMAQHGLEACGGPDDVELRELAYPCALSSWMATVLEQGSAVRGAPANDGDRDLASLLGDRVPNQAYLAPIESSGQVIALLYGDNLPEDASIGDTSALEVVLHHAGLALDRAALERALREGAG